MDKKLITVAEPGVYRGRVKYKEEWRDVSKREKQRHATTLYHRKKKSCEGKR